MIVQFFIILLNWKLKITENNMKSFLKTRSVYKYQLKSKHVFITKTL